MGAKQAVGFSRIVKLEWLERTAALVQIGTDTDEIRQILLEYVGKTRSVGKAKTRGSGEITATILLKTWALVHEELLAFRNDGLDLLRSLPQEKHLPIHWGMVMAAYPFFARVAENTGRLIRLQDRITVAQVQKRLREQIGERETVERATQRVLRTFVDWSVLNDTERRGVLEKAITVNIADPSIQSWLIEAILRSSRSDSIDLQEAATHPSVFPFNMPNINRASLEAHGRMEIHSQALNREMVMLK